MEFDSTNKKLQKTLNDLLVRKVDLLFIIDQIENHEKKDDYFSSVDHYKDALQNVNALIAALHAILDGKFGNT